MHDPAQAAFKSQLDQLRIDEKYAARRHGLDIAISCAPVLNLNTLDELFAAARKIEEFLDAPPTRSPQSEAA